MAKRERICDLAFDAAVKAIENTKTVMYKHGVWNPYVETPTESAIKSIKCSGYGADVSRDVETGIFYVSIPCDADMW